MTESELKRYLIKSIRAQDGIGHRIEDKYAVGWPDCVFIPKRGPVFFTEVKLVKTGQLHMQCTAQQEHRLLELCQPPHAYGVLLTYRLRSEALYIGMPGDAFADARYTGRPYLLDGPDWGISELLLYKFDRKRFNQYNQGLKVTASPLP